MKKIYLTLLSLSCAFAINAQSISTQNATRNNLLTNPQIQQKIAANQNNPLFNLNDLNRVD